jgi:hypothetical protein
MPNKRRIPRTIWLDENYKVNVKIEPPAMITAGYGEPGKIGYYNHATMTIHLDRTISMKRKWQVLRHELIHAIIDLDLEVNGGI